MNLNFTRPLLLLYACNETDLCGSDRAQRMIDGDPLIAAEYGELNDQLQELDQFRAEPSDDVIRRILAFGAENERG